MSRIAFLVDGFNLYHSVLDLQEQTGSIAKWLDVRSLCNSYLYKFGKDAQLVDVFYFSAPPHYLSATAPDTVKRYNLYMSCLEATHIKVELARFKERPIICYRCGKRIMKHEEKETDVAIAVRAMELLSQDSIDIAAIMSGDTDLSPLAVTCPRVFPKKRVLFVFPYARKNKELAQKAPGSFAIRGQQYMKHLLPDPLVLPNGIKIRRPREW